jgi:hypothetical protein
MPKDKQPTEEESLAHDLIYDVAVKEIPELASIREVFLSNGHDVQEAIARAKANHPGRVALFLEMIQAQLPMGMCVGEVLSDDQLADLWDQSARCE